MKNACFVMTAKRARQNIWSTTKSVWLPALATEVDIEGTSLPSGLIYFGADDSGWRRFRFMGYRGMLRELGKINDNIGFLYLLIMPKVQAREIADVSSGVRVRNLRAIRKHFNKLKPKIRAVWPADWYKKKADGSLNKNKPIVPGLPALKSGITRWAENVADAEVGDVEQDWQQSP